jgi:hypothetical protein
MSSQTTRTASPAHTGSDIRYPRDRIIAVVDTRQHLRAMLVSLLQPGVQNEDIATLDARDTDRMRATTGHAAPVSWFVRLAQRLGLKDDELEVKERYEEELRAGRLTVAVRATDSSLRARVIRILQPNGGHFIHSFGRYTIERVTV